MCGLVGVAGNVGFAEKRVFANLLWMDQMRGKHSTGVAVIDKNNDVELLKEVGPPMNLFNHKDWFDDDFEVRRYSLKALIGHNRYATIGAKTAENAHPFTHGDITGAHNGTLKHLYQLPNNKKFEVDSEAIFFNFNDIGVKKTMAHLNGAWALTWYNSKSETMNFMRNDERPLFYVYAKDESCIFWASDAEMLTLALDYSPIKYEASAIYQFKPFLHHTLDLKKGEAGLRGKAFEYDEEEIKGFTPPPVTYSNNHRGAGYNGFFENHVRENVRPIPAGNNGTPPDDEEWKKMQSYVSKEVEFFIKGERMDCNKVPYILGESVASGEYWEIRLYIKDAFKRLKYTADGGHSSYTATVKKVMKRWDPVRCKPDVYMLIDLRTLSDPINWDAKTMDQIMGDGDNFLVLGGPTGTGKDDIPFEWKPDLTYTGYKGKEYTHDEFVALTRNGCDWCCEDAENLHDPKRLTFISEDSFLCPICNKEGEAGQFYRV